jgi:prevent-host-death family protein
MSMMSASQARATLPQLLDRVAAGDEVTITRHGHPVAVLVRPDALRSRRAQAAIDGAALVHAALAAGRTAKLQSAAGGVSAARAEELIDEVRAGRERA